MGGVVSREPILSLARPCWVTTSSIVVPQTAALGSQPPYPITPDRRMFHVLFCFSGVHVAVIHVLACEREKAAQTSFCFLCFPRLRLPAKSVRRLGRILAHQQHPCRDKNQNRDIGPVVPKDQPFLSRLLGVSRQATSPGLMLCFLSGCPSKAAETAAAGVKPEAVQ